MCKCSPRMFWNLVRIFGPDLPHAFRSMFPEYDWSFLEGRRRITLPKRTLILTLILTLTLLEGRRRMLSEKALNNKRQAKEMKEMADKAKENKKRKKIVDLEDTEQREENLLYSRLIRGISLMEVCWDDIGPHLEPKLVPYMNPQRALVFETSLEKKKCRPL